MLAFLLLFEELNVKNSYSLALTYELIYWNEFIEVIKPNKEIFLFLKKCKQLGLSTCAISDMQTNFQIRKLEKLNAFKVIDFLVTSEEVGYEKPEAIIFEKALKKLQLEKSEVIMIGDDQLKDIEGAESFGIKAFKFKA